LTISKKSIKVYILALLFILISLVIFFRIDDIKHFLKPKDIIKVEEIKTELGDKIKSGSLFTDYDIDKVIIDIYKFRLNTINLPVVIDVDSNSPNNMKINLISKNKAIQLIKKLKRLGVNVILEPYPFINNGEISETAWSPTDINTWFWNWKTVVLSDLIKDIALPYKVYALNIASNFAKIEYAQGYWIDTIAYVRNSYKGLITYRTNRWDTAEWDKGTISKYENKLNNQLFSKLDFISVAAYFELTNKNTNSVSELSKALFATTKNNRKQNVYQEIKNFYIKTGKPIFFGELGFPKRNGASIEPWNPNPTNIINNIEQANCFEAYRNVFEKEEWFKGFSVFFIGDKDENREYYPSTESTDIIKNWFVKLRVK
jgi:hypothetical protein